MVQLILKEKTAIKTSSLPKGFTLIELVMVIIIIGILAAVALPKFANLTSNARTSANQGIAGGLASAATIVHASWIAAGASSSASTTTLEGTSVSINGSGWPDGTGGVAPTAANCATIWTTVLNNPPASSSTACGAGLSTCYLASATGSVCTFTLYSGGAAVTPATTITLNVSSGAVASAP